MRKMELRIANKRQQAEASSFGNLCLRVENFSAWRGAFKIANILIGWNKWIGWPITLYCFYYIGNNSDLNAIAEVLLLIDIVKSFMCQVAYACFGRIFSKIKITTPKKKSFKFIPLLGLKPTEGLPDTVVTTDVLGIEPIIEVKIREKAVGFLKKKRLLENINFNLYPGEIVALMGTTGAGKTTLASCLNGMDSKGVKGVVNFKGANILKAANFKQARASIGSVSQEDLIHSERTVKREIALAARDRLQLGVTDAEIDNRVNKVLEELNLMEVKDSILADCSGGQRRRTVLACELVADRPILILDEPESGLDPGTEEVLYAYLKRIAYEERRTIVVISHDDKLAAECDRVLFMSKYQGVGYLAYDGSLESLLDYYQIDNFTDLYELTRKDA